MSKGPNAFRTISEAADELDVPQHVLRFWETKFSFVRPLKRAGGRRFYRPQDVLVLRGVKALLYSQGYKIEGVQRLYRQEGLKRLIAAADPDAAAAMSDEELDAPAVMAEGPAVDARSGEVRARLVKVLAELEAAKAKLDELL